MSYSSYGKPWLLFGLLGCSLALNMIMVLDRSDDASDTITEEISSAALDADGDALASSPVSTDASDAPLPPAPGEWRLIEADVKHSLARTFRGAVDREHSDAISAIYARLFMWDIDMRRDLQRNDRVEVAWRPDDEGTIEIAAARLR